MKEKEFLSKEQIFCIAFMSAIGNIVYIHTWVYDDAGRAVWVASFIGILAVIPLIALLLRLGRHYGSGTLLDIISVGLGKFAAVAASLVYFVVSVGLAATHVTMFTALINTFFLLYTPPWLIMLELAAMGALFAGGRLTTLSRLLEVMAVLGVVNYFVTFIAAIPSNFHTEYVLPIFVTTVAGFTKSVYFFAGNAAETLLVLSILIGFIQSPEKKVKNAAWGILAGGVVFSLAILIINAVMSPELSKRIAFGGVNAARLLQVGDFLQGLEVFILMTYQLIAVCRLALFIYCAWTALKRMLGGKIPAVLLGITSAALFGAALMVGSYNRAYGLAVLAATYVSLPLAFLLIVLAAIGVGIHRSRFDSLKSKL
jgi:spore germination protein (amino acid permease)